MRKVAILILAIFIIAAFANFVRSHEKISVDEAAKMMTLENVLVVDVRTPEEYAQMHIPRAINLPLAEIKAGKLDALPDKNQILLLYCQTGRRSEEATNLLSKRGYENVFDFGGLVDWTGAVEGSAVN